MLYRERAKKNKCLSAFKSFTWYGWKRISSLINVNTVVFIPSLSHIHIIIFTFPKKECIRAIRFGCNFIDTKKHFSIICLCLIGECVRSLCEHRQLILIRYDTINIQSTTKCNYSLFVYECVWVCMSVYERVYAIDIIDTRTSIATLPINKWRYLHFNRLWELILSFFIESVNITVASCPLTSSICRMCKLMFIPHSTVQWSACKPFLVNIHISNSIFKRWNMCQKFIPLVVIMCVVIILYRECSLHRTLPID